MKNPSHRVDELVALVRNSRLAQKRSSVLATFNDLVATRLSPVDERIKKLGGYGNTAMSTNIGRCQALLNEIFDVDYPKSEFVLFITPGRSGYVNSDQREDQYRLVVIPRPSFLTYPRGKARPVGHKQFVRRFWTPHFESENGWIIYGEPFFVRRISTSEKKGAVETFIRDTSVNSQAHAVLKKNETPQWAYLRDGEVQALLDITALFAQEKCRLGVTSSRHEHGWKEIIKSIDKQETASIVVVGNTHSNGALSFYQKHPQKLFRYRSDGRDIIDRLRPRAPYRRIYYDDDSGLAYVLVSRRPGELGGKITMIASDSGRGMSRVGRLVCTGELLKGFFDYAQASKWDDSWPDSTFQFLIGVRIVGSAGTSWEVVDGWYPKPEKNRSREKSIRNARTAR